MVMLLNVMGSKAMDTLKNNHPDQWKELGGPGNKSTSTLRSDFLHISFLLKGDFKHLNNPELTRQYKRVGILWYISFVLTLIFLPSMTIVLFDNWN